MIETGLDRREAIPYPAEPRPEDLPLDEQYAVRADYWNSNLRLIMEAIGKVFFTGQHYQCIDGGYYGNSDSTHCRLTLPAGYTEIGDILFIGETQNDVNSRIWRVEVLVENAIEFTDANLIKGASGGNDYNTMQQDLWFMVVAKKKIPVQITKDEICLGNFDAGLHADDIQLSKTDTTTIKTKLDKFDVEHEADGSHSAGIIKNANFDKDDALSTQGYVNKVRNGAFYINDAASMDYWEKLGTPPVCKVNANTCGFFPAYELEIGTNDINQGVRQLIKECEANQPLRMCFWAKGNSGGEKIKAMMNDDSGSAENQITLTTTWTCYYLTFTPTSQCNIYCRVISDDTSSQTFKIAFVTVSFGDIHSKPERSSKDILYDAVHSKIFYIPDLQTAVGDEQYAEWIIQRDIKILRIDVYAHVAVDADVTIRLTDDSNNVDVTITNGNNSGNTVSTQEYSKNATLKLKVLNNASTSGSECNVIIQYRQV